jgi:hypothetical protein
MAISLDLPAHHFLDMQLCSGQPKHTNGAPGGVGKRKVPPVSIEFAWLFQLVG